MKIKVLVDGADAVEYTKLNNFQGDLKVLSESSYEKFKKNLIENGFIEPISVWIDDSDKGKIKILNGHQRLSTIKRMVENEGFQIDEIPINYVEASSYTDAKKKLLALTSEYGEMSVDGMIDFLQDIDMSVEEISTYLNDVTSLKNINIDDVLGDLTFEVPTIDDDLDVDTIVADEGIAPEQKPIEKPQGPISEVVNDKPNDAMTGLRLIQLFVTDEQLTFFKDQVETVIKKYNVKNTTEAILKAVEIAAGGQKDENNKRKKG